MPQTTGNSETASAHRIGSAPQLDSLFENCRAWQVTLVAGIASLHLNPTGLAKFVESLANELFWPESSYLGDFKQIIQSGTDPVDAIFKVDPLLPADTVFQLHLARSRGGLSELFTAIRNRPINSGVSDLGEDTVKPRFAGFFVRAFFIVAGFSFFCLWIVPEQMKLIEELGGERSPIFNFFLMISNHLLGGVGGILATLFLLTLSFLCFRRIRSRLKMFSPTTWKEKQNHETDQFRNCLTSGLLATSSLRETISELARCPRFEERDELLNNIVRKLDRGERPWEVLAEKQLITAKEKRSLELAVDDPTSAWLLQWSSKLKNQKKQLRNSMLIRVLVAIGNLFLTGIVILTAVEVVSFLTQLIELACEY